MQSEYDAYELFAMAAFNTLRLEALELFDRSLAKKQPAILEAFIERQMSQNVPPVDLLAQVSEDVHQRLQRLRQRNFELRETILRGAHNRFSIDLAPLLPIGFNPSHQSSEGILRRLSVDLGQAVENVETLRRFLEESLVSAVTLYESLVVADHLYDFVTDWLLGAQLVDARSALHNDVSDRAYH